MKRSEVRQHVIDALGIILVDKTLIQKENDDDVTLSALVLDKSDFDAFFADLQGNGIVLPARVKADLSEDSEHAHYAQLTLRGLIDLITVEMQSRVHH